MGIKDRLNSAKIERFQVVHGDSLEVLRSLATHSADSMVTDPPAGIAFMGREWDEDKGGRDHWIAWLASVMREAYRVLRPGAHGLVWALPRTSHWTATALEDAGFEIRDCLTHLFGSGFPKSHDISKGIDKAAGAEPIKGEPKPYTNQNIKGGNFDAGGGRGRLQAHFTSPATDAAKKWQGWGTALKPASEHWILVRKPCSEKTVAANVLKHGTGGLNIDACRIAGAIPIVPQPDFRSSKGVTMTGLDATARNGEMSRAEGRFPGNLILSHNHDCVEEVGTKKVKGTKEAAGSATSIGGNGAYSGSSSQERKIGHADGDGTETVASWECTDGCAVAMLDQQSGQLHARGNKGNSKGGGGLYGHGDCANSFGPGDSGGASRFFYCSKASARDKGDGNNHPTPKNTALMRYIVRLVTPANGLVLDPFAGSGSIGVAALRENKRYLGIEQQAEYVAIATGRCRSYFSEDND